MVSGETVSRSPLYKPLKQLTEDDISQLTREDCRRYLKEKGMRRPSWNKSQAIQQVISLKTLLETTTDSDAAEAQKKVYVPRQDNSRTAPSDSAVSVKGTSADTRISASAEEPVSYRRHDPPKPDLSGDPSGRVVTAENDSASPRTVEAANEPVGQMTIFYGGKVNVFDDIPSDKAQAIMQLAASPLPLPQAPSDVGAALWSFPCQLEATGIKVGQSSPRVIFTTRQAVRVAENGQLPREESNISREDNLDCPTSRKASVQRYLEKRKDRLKNKRKVVMPSTASLDNYFSQCVGDQVSSEQWNASEACSPPQPRPSHTHIRCGSVENIVKNANLSSAFINDKEAQEC